ncbi:hypothetical protein AB0C96_29590 [Streptomyces sp. NPDC048506]|uniref:hypothetical protein n=1 Tax=Streptomyces sp. NPDC048506 TaxID=3155028 RepID=UPI00341F04A7
MRKFIGRSVAAAVLATATVVPFAGVASAAHGKPCAQSSGHGQHGRKSHKRHHEEDRRFTYGPFSFGIGRGFPFSLLGWD